MRKRLFAALTALCLTLALLPTAASASAAKLAAPASCQCYTVAQQVTFTNGWYQVYPGTLTWKAVTGATHYRLTLYRDGKQIDTVTSYDTGYVEHDPSSDFFGNEDRESGTYVFGVAALGDGTTASDSAETKSAAWVYTKPSAKLAVPTGLGWNGRNPVFTKPAGAIGYMVRWYYAASAGKTPVSAGARAVQTDGDDTKISDHLALTDKEIQRRGQGYYYFKVRVLADVTKACNSDWSALSPAYSTAASSGGAAPAQEAGNPFTDVVKGQYFHDSVLWAVSKGVTTGTTATTFSPNATCSQAQILTFLWRAAGKTEPTAQSAYTDPAVVSSQYYYKALVWAQEKGVVTDAALAPNGGCTRADVVLYLWRLAGSPAASSAAFTDVASDAPYAQAVAWAVSKGITTGTGTATFSPAKTCTRGQIATFLCRYFAA